MLYKDIVPLLPDRNLRTISVRGHKIMQTKPKIPWSEEEIEYLIELMEEGKVAYINMVPIFNRTYIAIKSQGSLLIRAGKVCRRGSISIDKEWLGLNRADFPDLTDEEFESIS